MNYVYPEMGNLCALCPASQILERDIVMPAASNEIDIDKKRLLTRIGCSDDYEPSARITSLVDDYIENYQDFLSPAYTYVIRDILSVGGDGVTFEGPVTIKSRIIAELLGRCQRVAVFALTIGNHLEEMVAYLAENNLVLQATVLDAIGSGVAEKLAAYVGERIKSIVSAQGLVTSRRFSPGYCDWNVRQQKKIFRTLDGDTAGIRLTDSQLMMPRKSISGIIGIGLPDREIERYNPCLTCKKKECPGRR